MIRLNPSCRIGESLDTVVLPDRDSATPVLDKHGKCVGVILTIDTFRDWNSNGLHSNELEELIDKLDALNAGPHF